MIHYIFTNHDRRSYVESLKHLILQTMTMMSATSNLYEFVDYLESLFNRKVQ